MDTIIEKRKGWKRKYRVYAGGSILLVAVVLYLVLRDTSSALRVERDRLTIETVTKGEFNDFIRVIGHVMPSRIIYIDAVEGGRVEERIVEEGTMVKKGDVILRLSNPLLNISIMQSEADLAYQENELRNTRIDMEQERLRLKQERMGLATDLTVKKRRAAQYERLFAKELVAKEEYLQAQEAYALAEEQLKVVDERIVQDRCFRELQIKSLDENIANMKRSLILVRERLENLKIKAPVNGQLGNLDAQIGQSIDAGERIGQVITADLKIQAPIDEHYVERVMPDLPAGFERDGRNYRLAVTKVYPEVKEGQFKTDLIFTDNRPENIRAGQTYHINLQLGDPVISLLVPRGSFFQVTGGDWIYVLDKDGATARRRRIGIGRQNPQYYEVLEGLQEGERVVTSGYDVFGDNERLILK